MLRGEGTYWLCLISRREGAAIRAAKPIPVEFEALETRRQTTWAAEKKEGLLRPM